MSRGELLLYVVLPYAALAIFVIGHWWRYRRDQYGWGARSTQLLESRVLKYASTIFHLGVLAAIGGHVLGILIPKSWTAALGLSDSAYHVIAVIGGIAAGGAVCVGFALLVYRRLRFPRVRVTTTRADVDHLRPARPRDRHRHAGDADQHRRRRPLPRVGRPVFPQPDDPQPEPELMTGEHVTFIFQAHVTVVWLLVAFWPFSRLVHAWSVPVDYPRRSPVLYRSRSRRPKRRRPADAVTTVEPARR